jgi:multidrug efflux pump subunit AcrA (membrane-fusion protein)
MKSKPDHPIPVGPQTEFPKSPIKLVFAAAALVALITLGVVSGLIPRWRQHSELCAETRELSIPTVTVVSPKPGQTTAGLPLPAEIKPWVEAPIYARANGYLNGPACTCAASNWWPS